MPDVAQIDFDAVFDYLSTTTKALHTICEELGYGYSTVRKYIALSPELQERQAQARQQQADYIVESIMGRLDTCYETIITGIAKHPKTGEEKQLSNTQLNQIAQHARNSIDAIKWIACKFRPNLYGDKIEVAHNLDNIQDKFKQLFSSATISDKTAKPVIAQVTGQQQITAEQDQIIEIQPDNQQDNDSQPVTRIDTSTALDTISNGQAQAEGRQTDRQGSAGGRVDTDKSKSRKKEVQN